MATPNPQRADARRNRERLLAATLSVFAEEPQPTLEAVARRAGVGIGTLYRHFPTREALVEAAYRSELARLHHDAEQLLAAEPPDVALRTWMDHFADYVRVKRGMAETLRAIAATGAMSSSESRTLLTGAIRQLLDAGAAAGLLRDDVRADDVFAGLTGVFLTASSPDQAGRLLDLLTTGLRAG